MSAGAESAGEFSALLTVLRELPAVASTARGRLLGHGRFDDGNWWVKMHLDVAHPLAWRHVQELGYVLNYLSVDEPLPTVFKPVSPPPYMNGGVDFLSWVIESTHPEFTPELCAKWLRARLPDPVGDEQAWDLGDDG